MRRSKIHNHRESVRGRSAEPRTVAYLLYDDDCGPCTRFKNIVVNLDISRKLTPIPLSSKLAYELVRTKETREEMMQAFHIVYSGLSPITRGDSQARIFSAGEALIQLIRLLPLGAVTFWVIAHFQPLRSFIVWLYPHIAELRAISVSCKVSRRHDD